MLHGGMDLCTASDTTSACSKATGAVPAAVREGAVDGGFPGGVDGPNGTGGLDEGKEALVATSHLRAWQGWCKGG